MCSLSLHYLEYEKDYLYRATAAGIDKLAVAHIFSVNNICQTAL